MLRIQMQDDAGWPELNGGCEFKYVVKGKGPPAGLTVLGFYAATYPASGSEEAWRARLDAGLILVNGAAADAGYILR